MSLLSIVSPVSVVSPYLNELSFILNNNAKDSILLPDGSHLNCLLYADHLLLISTSAEGLQQSLDRLSKYCQDWLLKINPTKTKVIVFQKKSRKSAIDKHNFMVSNENIEIVNNYTYLRVKVSANGNFTNHKENLTEKTEILFCRLSLSRFSKITNSYHQQTVQYTIFPNFNVLL